MLATVVRVIRVAVQCRRLVSGVALDWLLHKQEESWVSGLVSRIWLLYKQEKNWVWLLYKQEKNWVWLLHKQEKNLDLG